MLNLQYFKITAAAGSALVADTHSNVNIAGLEFGTVSGYHICSANGSNVFITGDYRISGSASDHILAIYGGRVNTPNNLTATLVNNPNFAAFVNAQTNGVAAVYSITWSGTATGPRYYADSNGTIQTLGKGVNYFPGSAGGTLTNGGVYQ
jgi:hypothetical protein